jgi:hypothetical protein
MLFLTGLSCVEFPYQINCLPTLRSIYTNTNFFVASCSEMPRDRIRKNLIIVARFHCLCKYPFRNKLATWISVCAEAHYSKSGGIATRSV